VRSDKTPAPPEVLAQITPELREAVRQAAAEGRVTCSALLELAQSKGVSPNVVGATADAEGLKVHSCELGCF
jgi:hypothetical protein